LSPAGSPLQREAIKRRDHGEETLAEIGRSYNVSGWTISRLSHMMERPDDPTLEDRKCNFERRAILKISATGRGL
jgi:hypothetical protein